MYSALFLATFMAAHAVDTIRQADQSAEVLGAGPTLASNAVEASASARAGTMQFMSISHTGETLHGARGAAHSSLPRTVAQLTGLQATETQGNRGAHVAAPAGSEVAELSRQHFVKQRPVVFTISPAGLTIPGSVSSNERMVRSLARSGGEVKELQKEHGISNHNTGDSGSVPSKGRMMRSQAPEGGEAKVQMMEQGISKGDSGDASMILVVVILVVLIMCWCLTFALLFIVWFKRTPQLRPPLHTVNSDVASDTASTGAAAPLAVESSCASQCCHVRASVAATTFSEADRMMSQHKNDNHIVISGQDTSDGGGAATGGTGSKDSSYRDRRTRSRRTLGVTHDLSPCNSPRGSQRGSARRSAAPELPQQVQAPPPAGDTAGVEF